MRRAFGEVVREARKAAGLTQVQAAVALGMSPTWLVKTETGQSAPPNRDTTHALAAVLGLDPDHLWQHHAAPQRLAELHPDLFEWAETRRKPGALPLGAESALANMLTDPSRAGLLALLEQLPNHPDVAAVRRLLSGDLT